MRNKNTKETVTIQDIADKLNISSSTVSRALKNNSRISEKTKREVWRVARELGYYLHSAGYMYEDDMPKNIGIVVPEIDNSLYSGAICRIQEEARKLGYNIIVSYSNGQTQLEKDIIKNFLSFNLDGIIISLSGNQSESEYLDDVIVKGVPLVTIHNVNYELPVPKIILDAYQGTYKAVKHLISVGCKKIALLLGELNPAFYTEMINGFKTGLSSSGIQFKKDFILKVESTNGSIEIVLEQFFEKPDYPDAIITANSSLAIQTISYLKGKDVRVPNDVSLISFGSDPHYKLYSPSITSINFSPNELGSSAFKQLLDLIERRKEDKPFHEKTIITPVKLVIRGSSLKD